jgi:hypothetical protein
MARPHTLCTSTLREEIDLEQLNVHLLAVVEKTFLLGIAALWLQEPTDDILRFVQWRPAAQQERAANSQARTEEVIKVPCNDALAVSMVETGDVLRLFWDSPLEQH